MAWLLLRKLRQVCNDEEQEEQKETQMVQFGEQKKPRKLNVPAKVCVLEESV